VAVFSGKILMLAAAVCGSFAGPEAQDQTDRARLAAVLKKAEVYCQRLESAALDFVCFEEVTEEFAHFTPETDVYLYDYQFVRKNDEIKEKRALVAVDGKKTNVQDSRLQTVMFQYKNVLFGPIGLLSRFWQAYHDYRLMGYEKIKKDQVVIIEARPGSVNFEAHCYGKIWLKEDDGSVLKIVWDQKSLGNYQAVEEWAKSHGAEPLITAYTEYGMEKNGIRFPSRNFCEQACLLADKRKVVDARISTIYKNYKFFTVETEVKY
jgi:hypothetical protein